MLPQDLNGMRRRRVKWFCTKAGRPALGEYHAVSEVTGAHSRQFLRCSVSAVCLGD